MSTDAPETLRFHKTFDTSVVKNKQSTNSAAHQKILDKTARRHQDMVEFMNSFGISKLATRIIDDDGTVYRIVVEP